ncbi:MAG: sulfite exporter TauE/SafE family protein [Candidatus Omnitrophota bacterium]|nr:MAG: sulfite exporter TauE/SafE family protein [Candidatus Omnitrophota bacterium]
MMPILYALWLGILTSINPCPLATNIAAISFLSKRIEHIKFVFWAGLFYTIGRMVAYAILGFIITYSFLGVPIIANFLQKYMNRALGPILIIVGLFLLGVLKFNVTGFSISKDRQNTMVQSGIKGSFVLGFIFALSFCPSSAALFFGSLIPLSLSSKSGLLLPFVYGIGTGLPVIIFSVCIAQGVESIAHWFHKITKIEIYARKITGVIFFLVGLYYVWTYWLVIFINK